MELVDAIYNRRAVRDFTSQDIAQGDLQPLIEAAVQAPSAMNLQPWAFAVVIGRAALVGISQSAKAHLVETVAPDSPLAGHLDDLRSPEFDIFYGAPALVVICATSSESGAAEDCALAGQNFMLAAHAAGFGTCWIGFARPWLNTAEGKRAIHAPAAYAPVAPLIIGHPRGRTPRHPRRKPEVIWA
jgi:nitroreductase